MTDLLDRLRRALSDRYAIERELGRGGMAVVFLAEDLKHRRKVAIKVLSPDLSSDVGAERFLREIEIVAGLTHPHILPLHDSGQADDLLFCVMPYVEGESLRERLEREKQLPLEDAVQITREVAEALDYAHGCGIIHRDIKPANILLEHGHAVVADFGIARAVEQAAGTSITQTGLAMGTPAYMSPEQASGSDDVDGRADTYALGCVLYEMLSGETPFTGSTPQSVLAKKRSEPTPRVSVVRETVPPAVEAALTKSLAKTPADRFATAGQFAEALSARGEETEGKRPAWHWVAGLAAAVIITAIGAFVLQSGGPGRVPDASAGEVDRIVVAPFENRTGDPAAADWAFVAAEYIARGIDRAGEVTVVPARTVRDMARDADPAAPLTPEEIARRTAARYVLAGSYSTAAGRLRFDVDLMDLETGEVLRSLDPVIGSVDSLEAVYALLGERVTAATVARLNPDLIGNTWSSPPSLAAVEALLTTGDLFCRLRWQDVIDQSQHVLADHPDFSPLLIMVAFSYANTGRIREADSVLAIVEPVSEQLNASERLIADWLRARLSGNRAEATVAVEQAYRINPSRRGLHAGFDALETNRFEDALERLLANDRDTPCSRNFWPLWHGTARAYHMLGRYEEELEVAREALEKFPNIRPFIYFEAIALAGLGRFDAVDSLLSMVADFPSQPPGLPWYSPGLQTAYVALELEAMGFDESSVAAMNRALAWFEARPSTELRNHRGRVFYYAGRWSDADTLFEALSAEFPDSLDLRGYRGVALVHLGRDEEALEISRWLEALDGRYLVGAHTRWRAAIAAALGDRVGAVRLLEQAYQEGMRLGHFHRREQEWDVLEDYRPYQDFLRPRG
jgi:tetratricopeptide (TPR) repeat protein/TolB-like protein